MREQRGKDKAENLVVGAKALRLRSSSTEHIVALLLGDMFYLSLWDTHWRKMREGIVRYRY